MLQICQEASTSSVTHAALRSSLTLSGTKLSFRIGTSQMFWTVSEEDRRERSVHLIQHAGQRREYALAISTVASHATKERNQCEQQNELRTNGPARPGVQWQPPMQLTSGCKGYSTAISERLFYTNPASSATPSPSEGMTEGPH